MANELKHKTQGAVYTQTEFEAADGHIFDSQATGDLLYSASATVNRRLGIGTARYKLSVLSGIPAWLIPTFDGIVDAGGNGDWTTLQAGDDDLDAADYSMWVKQGTYAAGLTVSTNDVHIFVEPGTVIQAAITLSGDNVTLVLGAGCDVQGLITLSGANCSLICQNGCDIDGILLSGNFGHVDGGGWETISNGGTAVDGVQITGTDCLVENIAVQTTTGGGSSKCGINASAARLVVRNCKIIDSDDQGILLLSGAADCLVEGNLILGSDDDGIIVNGPRSRIVNNHIVASGAWGIDTDNTSDNSVIVGNIVQDPVSANQTIRLASGADNCVVVANRTDGTITDSSTGSTVASNDTTAF